MGFTRTSVVYATPSLTLGTANAAGSVASAIRSDSTLLVYDATIPATVTSGASTTGSASTSARRDHVHGIGSAVDALQTTRVAGSRTASAGAGTQAVTGAGFQPTAVMALSVKNGGDYWCIGFADDARLMGRVCRQDATPVYVIATADLMQIDDQTNGLACTVASYDADGCTLTWTKKGSGLDTHYELLFFR